MGSLTFISKSDYTKKRQNIDLLLKRAIKGSAKAQRRLADEYGIKIYSSSEIDNYEKGKRRKKVKNTRVHKIIPGSKKQTVKV